ncbi:MULTISPECIES: efflux RND transporter permease subunit [Brenneria]|uniref:Efflux pump membrane transporter n=1 Tax=Brenneria nigrifluens DSM 30175 = ATCC 13028 TaxID=1121120 RepID=A0A2U1UR20_9GAMM|nr:MULTISPECIES: efflux RND transporter permease subunit [Brenneria]EHD22312.1 transporter, hydrophobe/amphiphile efflux-1 (HAE1) family [Brenneria sp. EniD312]PWC24136.1 multidrug efflux RND transporter permease subunit [Brenneria nigrifluens DSM 30175 = ATCC 13028]QCR05328.1 multidrug efflux RND transporter permease subunit [Brenneria nigrifluens DSM 30175 = ATCC 13028]
MSRFFIDRPVFAWVIALVIMLAGGLSINRLPVNQYPNIAAPAIAIIGSYPGASTDTVQDTVVQVIEQQLSGLDNLRYLKSESNSDGSFTITATFHQGTDPDIAQVQVQNKLSLATPMIPDEVQSQGMRVVKYQVNFMLVVGLVSTDGRMNSFDLGDYAVSNLQDPLSRINGVGDFIVLGSQYAMRIWMDPARLNGYNLTPLDVSGAIQAQNVQVSSGQLGGLPTQDGTQLNATVIGKTRFTKAEQFENILLKVQPDGSRVLLKDVARVELGAESFSIQSKYGGDKPSTGIALRLGTGANALDTISAVKAKVDELKAGFPPGMEVVYPYDNAPFISESIESVVHTLLEAIVLVFLVILLFLQNWRATLIPTMAVPVVLLGTFGVMAAFGFSINLLTMFGLVLAIGLLVDDAIVVVENVERLMTEERLSPLEATRKSMDQISGALVGIGLVLSAVFVPMAFFGGSTGVIYRQFSITIVSAMALSVLVALIFTPVLCVSLLRPVEHQRQANKKGFFGWFNRNFDRGTSLYRNSVVKTLNAPRRAMLFFGLIIAILAALFPQIPTSFLPDEDQGQLMVQVQMPPNSSAEQTQKVLTDVSGYFLDREKDLVSSALVVNGFNFAGRGQGSAMGFVQMRPWAERDGSVYDVANRAMAHFSTIKQGSVIAFVPPAVPELGSATGFNLFLEDRGGNGHEKLMQARNQLLAEAARHPALHMVRPNGMNDEPQYRILIDDEKVQALKLSLSDVNSTMSAAWGSSYVNDFNDRGRVKKVYIQGIAAGRISPQDFDKWYVRNSDGDMVSFASFASGKWVYGSPKLERYNGLPAMELLGEPAPGYSSGEAMQAVEDIAAKLPDGFHISWTGLSYEERLSGSQAPALYALSLLIVFLCLAALYESWSIPLSVMLVVPLGVIGAVAATLLRGLGNDVFFQVGLLTTIGLSAKNAILIVEFARDLHEKTGKPLKEAAIEAARVRLRPIIMTSLAFVMGVIPLAVATGVSSGSKHAIGTGVVGGMLTATVLAIFYIPLFYVLVAGWFSRKK